jgi:dihydroorotate dehydrogenase (NAD+) catalytic subunit
MTRAFYDPNLSYQENYDLGPFGPFSGEPPEEDRAALQAAQGVGVTVGGIRLRRGIGIPAGPLLNSKFTDAAFRWGYDLCHYKTVRSRTWPSHPAPNVLFVDAHDIPPEQLGRTELTARRFGPDEPVDLRTLSITNSFGMPAQPPQVWQADMERAVRGAGHGQALVASVYGTPGAEGDPGAYVADFARAAAMCAETGVHAIEVNLSCPNVGRQGLLCHDPEAAARVCRAAREAIGDRPLFAKIGSFPPDASGDGVLERVVAATAPYLQGYGVVNAVPVPVVSASGDAALPGSGRALAGVCGAALKPTGLDMVRRVARLRDAHRYDYSIIGVGGLASAEDFLAYLEAGADAVQGATGPMWNHRLAVEIATALQPQLATYSPS